MAETYWAQSPTSHRRVIFKYARKIKGGGLLHCEQAAKVVYATRELAQLCEEALEQVGAHVQYVYSCRHCQGFHLTRQRQL